MPKITFSKHHDTSHAHFWTWRDENRRLERARAHDAEQLQMFAERAAELREEVEFLLGAGLSEGAEQALAALAEEDMADFCILVDLAEPIDIAGVEPLTADTRDHLRNFLATEPWQSLAVDNDITVALAMLDEIGASHTDRPWYTYAPHLVEVLARATDNANAEQLRRFIGEYNELVNRDQLQLPEGIPGIFHALVHSACQRLGMPMLSIENG